MDGVDIKRLEAYANRIRRNALKMIHAAGSGHPGGSLSCADIIAALYFGELRLDPENPGWPDRDRFILSKGHACPAYYAALAERGFFPTDALATFRRLGSILQGHPDMRKTPGVDMTTGSLGQGLSAGVGMALGARLDGKDLRVYVLVGDGEIDEGQVWEATMAAAKFALGNLTVFMDCNGLQVDGRTEDIMPLEPVAEKLRAFNWNVAEIDGHDMRQILDAIALAKSCPAKPTWIVARTVKGKGVPFMENETDWHGKPPSDAELRQALEGLG